MDSTFPAGHFSTWIQYFPPDISKHGFNISHLIFLNMDSTFPTWYFSTWIQHFPPDTYFSTWIQNFPPDFSQHGFKFPTWYFSTWIQHFPPDISKHGFNISTSWHFSTRIQHFLQIFLTMDPAIPSNYEHLNPNFPPDIAQHEFNNCQTDFSHQFPHHSFLNMCSTVPNTDSTLSSRYFSTFLSFPIRHLLTWVHRFSTFPSWHCSTLATGLFSTWIQHCSYLVLDPIILF